jgi:peptidoglycan/LPS O-acetylase OafA/YrhL
MAFKGFAILLIIIHNFMHRFPLPTENEMYFDENVLTAYIDILLFEPMGSVRATFSFLGHFGVQVFVFLSAYGLSQKYKSVTINYKKFIFSRLNKLYPPFLLAIGMFVFYKISLIVILYGGGTDDVKYFLLDIIKPLLLKLTLLWNLYPGQGFSLVGPWWFLSVIFQFYIIFPILLMFSNIQRGLGLFVLSILSILFSYFIDGEIFGVSVYFTVIGHMPLLCLGIYFSLYVKSGDFLLTKKLELTMAFLFVIFIFILGNIYQQFFYLTHISFFIVILYIFSFIMHRSNKYSYVYKILYFYGSISLPLFLINGFLREPLEPFAHKLDNEFLIILICLSFLGFTTVIALVFDKVMSFYYSRSKWQI